MTDEEKEGVLYIAFGEKYIKEAEKSAESLKRHNDIHVTVYSDDPSYESTYFDRVKEAKESDPVFLQTIKYMSKSPYDRTVYLDTDVHVAGDISDMFTLLDEFDFAAKRKSGFYPTDPGMYSEIPESFPEFNRGILAYRATPEVNALFDEWYSEYESHIDNIGNDQPPLRKVLYRSDIRLAYLNERYHCRFVYPGYVTKDVKLFHGRPGQVGAEMYEEVTELINKTDHPRIFYPTDEELYVRYRVNKFNLGQADQYLIPFSEHLFIVLRKYVAKARGILRIRDRYHKFLKIIRR